jgi:DNA-directed RNA polymerase subunit RPC12/RpoP
MAAVYVCDGCGTTVERPTKLGYVLPRDYCERCARNAEAFLDSVEDELQALRSRFDEVRQSLIAVHGKDGFKLPDLP